MSLESLRKVWLALALVGFVFAISAHTRLQGGPFEFILKPVVGIVLEDKTPKAILAMWGIYFLSVFVIAANYVLRVHSDLSDTGWKNRYPFRLLDLPVDSDVGAKSQVIAFVLLTLSPMISLGHFWNKLIGEGVLCSRASEGKIHSLSQVSPFGFSDDWSLSRMFED